MFKQYSKVSYSLVQNLFLSLISCHMEIGPHQKVSYEELEVGIDLRSPSQPHSFYYSARGLSTASLH